MKKVFRPLGNGIVQKMWLGDGDACPAGWFDTVTAANAAHRPQIGPVVSEAPVEAPPFVDPSKPKRGRPRKS